MNKFDTIIISISMLEIFKMLKKTSDIGQPLKKGSDKRRRTYELYGKMKPIRQGDVVILSHSHPTSKNTNKKSKKKRK